MKLIVDISEDTYTRLFDNGIQGNEIAVDDVCEMVRVLRLGTPLDDVRAEIEEEYNRLSATRADETLELGECLGLKMALKILDHIGRK